MSNGGAAAEPTFGTVLGECHRLCSQMEDKLSNLVASPIEKAAPATGPLPSSPEAEQTMALQYGDLLNDVGRLARRLSHLDEHINHLQETLKAMA